MQKDSEFYSTNYMLNVFRKKSLIVPSTSDVGEEKVSLSESLHPNNDNDNNNEINNASENDIENVRSLNDIRSVDNANSNNSNNLEAKSISHPLHELIKEDRMLVRVERLNYHETLRRYGSHFLRSNSPRKHLTHSLGWREYIVKLRPGIIELYEDNVWFFDLFFFNMKYSILLFY
jgi:hypothetical protein